MPANDYETTRLQLFRKEIWRTHTTFWNRQSKLWKKMKKRIWLELPLRRDVSNTELLHKLKNRYPYRLIHGIVFSDRAAGLPHFCDAEQLVQRGIIRELLAEFPYLEVVNICRTGDRCSSHLSSLIAQLKQQGTSRVILVSGHEYRSTLKLKSLHGDLCARQCARGIERNVLCGQASTLVLKEHSFGLPVGAVTSNPELDFKSGAGFHLTQIAPLENTAQWLDRFPAPVILTVMPLLNITDLSRVAKLGASNWSLSDSLKQSFTPQLGMELAKQTLHVGMKHDKVEGFYIYSPSPAAASELILNM